VGTNEVIIKHKESKKTREMIGVINSSNRTGTVENRVKPTIDLKTGIKTLNI